MTSAIAAILVADIDERFIAILNRDERTSKLPIVHAKNSNHAKDIISDPEQSLLGIFVSPELHATSWLSVIKSAHAHCPLVPIHLIKPDRTSAKPISDDELKHLGIKQSIQRELSTEELSRIVSPILARFDKTQAMAISKSNTDALDAESSAQATDFHPIRARDFVTGVNSVFDVYARTPLGRHLKLIHAGDDFEFERLTAYLSKGVDFFYIRKEAQKVYLQYCDFMAMSLLNSKTAPLELKQRQFLNSGEELNQFVASHGMSELALQFAEKYSNNLRTMLSHLEIHHKSMLSKFMADTASYDHAVGVSMLAGVLANELGITSEGPLQTVAVASLFHDFSLIAMPAACRTENESLMSPEERQMYRDHPRLSAEALGMLPSSNLAAVQAIQQHHMKLKNHGFPDRNATTLVSRIAEIVGACSELNHIMKACQDNPDMDMIEEVEREIVPYYSRGVVNAFKAAFYPKTERLIG